LRCLFFVRFCVMIVRCRGFSERHGSARVWLCL
jgi:hypothetical protein